MMIQQAGIEDAGHLSKIVSQANIPVARQFGLNLTNAPSHPSFCTQYWIKTSMDRGEAYFMVHMRGQAVGCVAYESPEPDIAYLNRLAVLPAFQNKGMGRKMVSHVIFHAQKEKKKQVSIGIIKAHEGLRDWYFSQGFEISGTKVFDHLPFDVLFMTLRLVDDLRSIQELKGKTNE